MDKIEKHLIKSLPNNSVLKGYEVIPNPDRFMKRKLRGVRVKFSYEYMDKIFKATTTCPINKEDAKGLYNGED